MAIKLVQTSHDVRLSCYIHENNDCAMNTITINDTEYVSTREIERHYNLNRNKCWKLLQRVTGLEFVTIARLRHFPAAAIEVAFASR